MSSEIQKWIDPAMYAAEGQSSEDGPKVTLLWMTPDPLGAAAAMQGMYPGPHHIVPGSLSEITREMREAILPDMERSVLKAPSEAIKLHFVVEGVTRAFTHQLVRNRTSVFAQESQRFAVVGEKGNFPVALPPSLASFSDPQKIWNTLEVWREHGYEGLTEEEKQYIHWKTALEAMADSYSHLVNSGMPAEDARGLLPTNVLTRIQWVTDLRSLQQVASVRLSTQAQFEWKAVIAGMARAIREYNPYAAMIEELRGRGVDDHTELELNYLASLDRWQYEAISNLFRPICYKTGKCEFMGSADRFCTIRERVQANAAIGRPSSEWHKDLPALNNPAVPYSDLTIQAIHPAEWLADPTAAR